MKNFTQKFTGILALVFTMSLTVDAQVEIITGCTNSSANNYDSGANTDDGSCTYAPEILVIPEPIEFTNGEISPLVSSQDLWDFGVIYDADNSLEELTITLSVNPDEINLVWDGGINSNPTLSAVSDFSGSTEIELCISDDVSSVCASNIIIVYEGSPTEEESADNYLDLPEGWSMFGYTCLDSVDAIVGFSSISDKIEIVKDEWGLTYLPSWEFNAMGSLHFSEGYQIKMIEAVTDFQFCEAIVPEDGIGQADVDAAVAAVDITTDNQAAFDEGAASVTPEDGIGQADLDALAESYEGWCESDLDNDGICDVDEVSGCMDASSCNYLSAAEFDDSSCEYGQEGYDCDGNVLKQIGDQHAGGIVFQINEDGTGLVADLQDLGVMDWYSALGAAEDATSQGYEDWYLPSIAELELMWNTIGQGANNIGNFGPYWYWSSSEGSSSSAWGVNFISGNAGTNHKDYASRVRVIRAF